MRNTLEHPITKEEIVQFLHTLQTQIMDEGRIGDMRPTYLMYAINAVLRCDLKDIDRIFDSISFTIPK